MLRTHTRTGTPRAKVYPYGAGVQAERGGAGGGRGARPPENAGEERLGRARGQEGDACLFFRTAERESEPTILLF